MATLLRFPIPKNHLAGLTLRAGVVLLLALAWLLTPWRMANSEKPPGITPIPYTLPDGTVLTGFLSLPPDYQQGERYPAVLLIHGWHGVSRQRPHGLAQSYLKTNIHQEYLNKKYVVFSGEYYAEHLGDDREFQSMAAALKTLAGLPAVDGRRIAVVGVSHGGYLSLMCMMHPGIQPKPKIGVSISGVVDVAEWVKYLQSRKENAGLLPGLRQFANTAIPRAFGWPPDKDPRTQENFARISVLSYVKNLQGPVLVIHSSKDLQVPISQAYRLRDAARQINGLVTLSEVPGSTGDGHLVFLHNPGVWQEIGAFLANNL